jgi:hypothetical protein
MIMVPIPLWFWPIGLTAVALAVYLEIQCRKEQSSGQNKD